MKGGNPSEGPEEFLIKAPILLWRLAHHAHHWAFNTLIFRWLFGRQS